MFRYALVSCTLHVMAEDSIFFEINKSLRLVQNVSLFEALSVQTQPILDDKPNSSISLKKV